MAVVGLCGYGNPCGVGNFQSTNVLNYLPEALQQKFVKIEN
jgi:hypothetical protein